MTPLRFTVDVYAEHESLTLRVSGPPGTKEIVEAELLTAR